MTNADQQRNSRIVQHARHPAAEGIGRGLLGISGLRLVDCRHTDPYLSFPWNSCSLIQWLSPYWAWLMIRRDGALDSS